MQTFLPYPSFIKSAGVLDCQRLGKQRVEAWQLLNALHDESNGWRNHPALKMWIGYSSALASYGAAICEEWIRRGYHDTMLERFLPHISYEVMLNMPFPYPPWFGNEDFHSSHRSNLLRKDPIWYGRFGWTEPDNLPYVWPKVEQK